MKKNAFLIILLILTVFVLCGCNVFHDGKICQDKLPWIKSGQVLMVENFDNSKTKWEEVSNAYELKRYSEQGYFVSVIPSNSRTVSTSGKVFSDAKFSVEAQKIIGSKNTNYGLVCRYQDKHNFYGFVVATDGYAGIYLVKNGQTELISGDKFIFTDAINQDDGINMIVASCIEDRLSLSVNAKELITVKDTNFIIGELGVFLETTDEGNASATFNEFIVVKP